MGLFDAFKTMLGGKKTEVSQSSARTAPIVTGSAPGPDMPLNMPTPPAGTASSENAPEPDATPAPSGIATPAVETDPLVESPTSGTAPTTETAVVTSPTQAEPIAQEDAPTATDTAPTMPSTGIENIVADPASAMGTQVSPTGTASATDTSQTTPTADGMPTSSSETIKTA